MVGGNGGEGDKLVKHNNPAPAIQSPQAPDTVKPCSTVLQGDSSLSLSFSVGYFGVDVLDNRFRAENRQRYNFSQKTQ